MTRLVVDSEIHTKLLNLTAPVELCDEAGRVIARVFPVIDPALYVGRECPFPPEEIERRKQERSGKTYTTAEVLERLRSL